MISTHRPNPRSTLTHAPTLHDQSLILTGDAKAINNWVTHGKAINLFKPWDKEG